MKKKLPFFSKYFTLAIFFCLLGVAEAYDEGYWPRSYFVTTSMGITFTNGDLNKHSINITDSNGIKTKAYPPDLQFIGTPEITLGANVREFSVNVAFQYWKSEQNLIKVSNEEEYRFWRLGFEVTYNILWPQDFQVGLGIGYSYTSLSTKNSVFDEKKSKASELMGSGATFIANAHYYFNDYFAIVPLIKIHENWFKNIYTKQSGNLDLDPFIWQTFITTSIALQFQF